jgi:peptidyl-prolyl cis-trans isomerase C
MDLAMDSNRGNLTRLSAGRICVFSLASLLLLCGCKSSSGSANLGGFAAGQAAQIREQIARLGQSRDVPVAGAIAGAGNEAEIHAIAAEIEQAGMQARGQEPDGRLPAGPAGSTPPPLSLPPPPASLGMPSTEKPKQPAKESTGVAKLNAPEGLAIGRPLAGGVVVAMVNGQASLEEEVRVAMIQGGLGEGQPMAEQRRLALETLIDRELVVQDCTLRLSKSPQAQKFLDKLKELAGKEFERYLKQIKGKNRIESDEEFEKILEAQGMPLELMRRQQERNFIAMNYLQQRVMSAVDRIGRAELEEYYRNRPDEFKVRDSVRWRHLFIAKARHNTPEEAKREAESLAARVRAGEDFVELSRKHCHGDSALRGGEGVGRFRGEIKPAELEDTLFKMRPGEVGPVVELRTGYHVFQLVDREYEGQKPFDEKVQKQIKARLREEASQREMKAVVTELKRSAVIEYMER